MKKRKKKSVVKTLQDQAERAWKEYIYLRDGRKCMVKAYYPALMLMHDEIMQADHCFSRTDKNLFLEPPNGTCICRCCNMAKGFGQKSIARLVDDIVIDREGKEVFDFMKAINLSMRPNPNWKDPSWLADQIRKLKMLRENL